MTLERSPMNIILIGTGRMGRLLKECALDAGDAVVGEYGRANIAELAAAPAADYTCDVVIAGAGIGGLAAAVAAVEEGASVVLVEASGHVGGFSSANTPPSSGAPTTRSASPCSHARFAS